MKRKLVTILLAHLVASYVAFPALLVAFKYMMHRPTGADAGEQVFAIFLSPVWAPSLMVATPVVSLARGTWPDNHYYILPAAYFVTFTVSCYLISAYRERRRRAPASLCSRCGYDLRATPGRCPECGAVPAGKGYQA